MFSPILTDTPHSGLALAGTCGISGMGSDDLPTNREPTPEDDEIEAHLEAELTRYLERAQAERTPPRLLELARELQRKLRERGE
jgi:hypothetical protein